jgi:phosphoribosylformylglycinamidine synthase
MKLRITVMPRLGILDPQGKAIAGALGRLGHGSVQGVRAGKVFLVDVGELDEAAARGAGKLMAETLLSNPVIEDFEVEVVS